MAQGYPRSWRHVDPDGAARVLAAISCGAPARPQGSGHRLEAVFTVRGYPAQLSEWHDRHRHWVEAEFTVAPTWPLFTLIRSDGRTPPASSGEIRAGWVRLDDVAGCELWTPDAARARALVGSGLGDLLARQPLERLRVGAPASSLRSAYGARLNADTAQWARELIEALLAGAPAYESLGLIDMAPGVSWTEAHLDRNLGITPPDAAG